MTANSLPIVWSPEAEADLLDIWDYLATEASLEIADRQLAAIVRASSRIAALPFSGRARGELAPGVRSVLVHPYIVLYRPTLSSLEIVHVLHGSRDVDSIFREGLS